MKTTLETLSVISPIDGQVLLQRPLATPAEIASVLSRAQAARAAWRATSLDERAKLCSAAIDYMVANRDRIALDITRQMGRPISQSPGEVRGLEERARYMIGIAAEALADVPTPPKAGFQRFIRREPHGTVLVLAPWNYPFLTVINSVIPALMAGNTVILKHSEQTPLCSEMFAEAFEKASLPEGVFQFLHLDNPGSLKLVSAPEVDFVAFTGSVAGGHAVQRAAAERFIGIGLELGGKDPAYVRADADLANAIENLVDGAFFNSGQSCCGIERIYVHRSVYDEFVEGFVKLTRAYRFGNPLDPNVNLGPMVRSSNAEAVRSQIREAVAAGALALIEPGFFEAEKEGAAYLAPQVLVNVTHEMRVMREESFGPVIGIMPVDSDEEALSLMNDSPYGLTASLWTQDVEAAEALGNQLETGTVFLNRCDYLDPALAWTGVKDTGRGCSLSVFGYGQLTRLKSFHFKL